LYFIGGGLKKSKETYVAHRAGAEFNLESVFARVGMDISAFDERCDRLRMLQAQ
jgi:hypothetical protein